MTFALLALSLTSAHAVIEVVSASNNETIKTMDLELKRSLAKLRNANKVPLYYLAYRLYEGAWEKISATNGAVHDEYPNNSWRMLAVDLRVGTPKFDNTHFLRGKNSSSPHQYEKSTILTSTLPTDGAGLPLQQCLWLKTDEAYKAAQQRYSELVANNEVMSAEDDKSDDFSSEPIHNYVSPIKQTGFDRALWTDRVKRLSMIFLKHPTLLQNSTVAFVSEPQTRYFVNSEGSEMIEQHVDYHLMIVGSTLADDGMSLSLNDTIERPDPSLFPDEKELAARVEKLATKLEQLRKAPVAEPYVGPAILSGKAAAVFFHESFGHRVEAVHEKSENEGKTFAKKLGSPVMPNFLTVVDDPTIEKANGEYLNGFYKYDDEGVPGQAVTLAKNGILTGFLLDRTMVQGFHKSNGHGRSSPGWNPVARQANLIVTADAKKQVPFQTLRALLVSQLKKQHKTYGLLFDEIQGGHTYTTRGSEQTYYIQPLIVYKIFADGKPDQLIRGAEIIGTPLAALEHVVAAGTDRSVFNGVCGRESGPVPVSAVAPSLLIESMETKRAAKSFDKIPILPPPPATTGGAPAQK
ncbi:MAG: TldD/PmbA family protein [Cyanobacteria bacterium SZAS-4]|nr:TldD/PmbA family protein [Cyanobacteria bacterium SZAS-4]